MTLNQRLKSIFEQKKLKANHVAAELEIDYRQFNNWLNQTKPSIEGLQKILNYFPDIDARWLLTGEPAAGGTYKLPPEKVDYVNDGKDYCRLCLEKDKQIALLNKLVEVLEGKKEAGASGSSQFGEGAKGNKASGF